MMARVTVIAGWLGVALLAAGAPPAYAAGPCVSYYDATVSVPSGWAAAYDVFHVQHTPLEVVDCTQATVPLTVGEPNDSTVFVFNTAYVYPSDAGVGSSAVTNASTPHGTTTLHFASVPGQIVIGQAISDGTTPGAISEGATVASFTATTVEMIVVSSSHIAPDVGSGDTIVFSPTWRAVPLSAAQPAVNGWLAVPATAPLNLSSGQLTGGWNYIAFVSARWSGSQWLIGCADPVCAQHNWSLQAIGRDTVLKVTLTPVSPTIADTTALGDTVGTIACSWSDGSPCTATFSLTDTSGIYDISGSDLIVKLTGPGVGAVGSSDTVRITATQ